MTLTEVFVDWKGLVIDINVNTITIPYLNFTQRVITKDEESPAATLEGDLLGMYNTLLPEEERTNGIRIRGNEITSSLDLNLTPWISNGSWEDSDYVSVYNHVKNRLFESKAITTDENGRTVFKDYLPNQEGYITFRGTVEFENSRPVMNVNQILVKNDSGGVIVGY